MRGKWLASGALMLLLALVVARACTLEVLRDAFPTAPGAEPAPRGAGPATSVILDWLSCALALLTLFTGRVRWGWAHLFFASLGALATLSAIWADDKFAALVQGFHLFAAAAIFFTASQLIASWGKLRLIAAVCFGLLVVYAANGAYYRLIELPALREHWNKEKQHILREHGWEENSFQARQFGQRIENGAMMGFNSSPNSFAAVIVVLAIVSSGLLIQRRVNRDGLGLSVAIGWVMATAIVVLFFTQSKAAFATLILGFVLFAIVARGRKQMAAHPTGFFWLGVSVVVLAMAAVAGHGVYHHGLPGSSLNFRWQYWVASAHLFLTHPWLGVGWDNFGLHYLAFRLPEAPEEIKDPHNFLLRFFIELGAAGGTLAIALLLSFWWKVTRPTTPPLQPEPEPSSIVTYLLTLSALALVANVLISLDLNQNDSFVYIEIVKRFLFFCLFLLASVIAAVASTERGAVDGRRGPWVLYGILIGLGLFLVHNLIEFSLFEPGPMMLFALLAGAAMGVRTISNQEASSHALTRHVAAAVLSIALLTGAILLVIPVVRAENVAQQGDENLRTGHLNAAVDDFSQAFQIVPWNADYAQRCAMAMIYSNAQQQQQQPPDSRVLDTLDKARSANPSNILTYLTRARYEMQSKGALSEADIEKSYARVLDLNPNDVDVRLEYAAALERLGKPAEALQQYRRALEYNDKLNADEPKRLSPGKLEEIRQRIERLAPH